MCQHGTKLAPNLKPVHECTVIPQETCSLKHTSPRKAQKPLISEWCQDDSPPVPDQVSERDAGDTCGAGKLVNKSSFAVIKKGFLPFSPRGTRYFGVLSLLILPIE